MSERKINEYTDESQWSLDTYNDTESVPVPTGAKPGDLLGFVLCKDHKVHMRITLTDDFTKKRHACRKCGY